MVGLFYPLVAADRAGAPGCDRRILARVNAQSSSGPAPEDPGARRREPDGTPRLFREEQHFRQWWLWALVIVPAAVAWWAFIRQVIGGEPFGQNPGPDWLIWIVWALIGLVLPFMFGLISLIVDVTREAVHIHYRPFVRRSIPLSDVVRVEARTYNAVKEYGGWGVKGWSPAKRAYNVSGNRGAEVFLADGRSVLLGSQRADELAGAIQSGLGSMKQEHPGA